VSAETVRLLATLAAAAIVGFSKTGVPGTGILAIPILALAWQGRLAIGVTLPLLLVADTFAVLSYRSHARWDHLRRLAPWVVGGMLVGCWALVGLGQSQKDVLTPFIGAMVLVMLALSLVRGPWAARLVPTSPVGRAATGLAAGFSTLVSNAAGPLMQIYVLAAKLPKEGMMGTTAVYFFVFNAAKIPLLVWVDRIDPAHPIWSDETWRAALLSLPVLIVAALYGRRANGRIQEEQFRLSVLWLTFLAATWLIVGKWALG
jgi:uncharacterized protein